MRLFGVTIAPHRSHASSLLEQSLGIECTQLGVPTGQEKNISLDRISIPSSSGLSAFHTYVSHKSMTPSGMTAQEKDEQIESSYQFSEKNHHCRDGASGFLAYLWAQHLTLNEASPEQLQAWALTLNGQGNFPNAKAFVGAQNLCAHAAQARHLSEAQAARLAACTQPECSMELLRSILANPHLSAAQKDALIALSYQRSDMNTYSRAGASGLLLYLHAHKLRLSDVSAAHLRAWALTPNARGNRPGARAMIGAQNLCARAVEAGYLAAPPAAPAARTQQEYSIESLRIMLAKPGLTAVQKDELIWLNYQSNETCKHRRAGASGFLAYLHAHQMTLNEANARHLDAWALTPNAKGQLPHARVFVGTKGLCVIAAGVGHIPASSAARLAACIHPLRKRAQGNRESTSSVFGSAKRSRLDV